MGDKVKDYPNAINPNANPSGTLALERAKLAMSLANNDSPEAKQIQAELLDQSDYIPDDPQSE